MQMNSNKKIAVLFQRHRVALISFLGRMGVRNSDAEDLAQEAFVRALRVADWRSIRNPRAYLCRIAANLQRDRIRREIRERAAGLETGVILDCKEVRSSAPTPEDIAVAQDEFRRLKEALESLPPKTRRVMLLTKFQNLSYAEAGAVIGISPRTVEKHVARGVAMCVRHMRAEENRVTHGRVVSFPRRKDSSKRKSAM